ncbi:MAG TPA: hypothetical protein VJR69_08200 [Nitrospira sp.]|nr:hypothetical protein [Nitrospira sp.]
MSIKTYTQISVRGMSAFLIVALLTSNQSGLAATAPSTYSAYTGTDAKAIPSAPALGAANSIINDPTFGSRILRVTDANTFSGNSLIPEYAGYYRTWNANSTALKLMNGQGSSYWLEFNPSTFKVGDGSARPQVHPLSFPWSWEWSAVDPDVIYFLNGNQLAKYNKVTTLVTNLGGPPNGDSVTMHVTVVGQDSWVCATAGAGSQNTYTKIYCLDPNNPSQSKFIDVVNKTINGIKQSDLNWPTSAAGQTIGIHSMYGSAVGGWLDVVFHQQSWGANGDSVFNLARNTWSLVTSADTRWSGHASMGNSKFVNGAGSINGVDSRGALLRDPDHLMDTTQYTSIMQPPSTVGWYDAEHSSWFNASTNPQAPVLFSRYNCAAPPGPLTWYGEIIAAATDGSNTVWRFAHNHNGGLVGFAGQSFAQISNDGRWVLFSSYWDGKLGAAAGDFGFSTRIDTFIVDLQDVTVPAQQQAGQPTISTSSASVPAGASISVTVSNGPGNATDWVGVYPSTAPNTGYVAWKYLNGTTSPPSTGQKSASLTFTMPSTPGTYQFRFLANNGYNLLATSPNVVAGGGSTSNASPTISTSSASVPAGAFISVTVSNGPGSPTDWVGVYASTGSNYEYISWQYLNGSQSAPSTGKTGGSLTFAMPSTPGTYQFRFLANDGYNLLATSPNVVAQ